MSVMYSFWVMAGALVRQSNTLQKMLELSIQQREDNAAMTDRIWEMIDAEIEPTEPPASMSQAEALNVLRESIRMDAEAKEAGQ
jgi:hypothetical protein